MSKIYTIFTEHHHDNGDCHTELTHNDPNLEMIAKLMAAEVITEAQHDFPMESEEIVYVMSPGSHHIIKDLGTEYNCKTWTQQFECCNPKLKPGKVEHC